MDSDEDGFYPDTDQKPIWNLCQFSLSILCFISVSVLYKIPIDYYFGSGWTLVSSIIFLLILFSPIIYLQLRLGSSYKTGMLGIMDRFLPLGLLFTIGCYLRNFIHVIYTSGLITHCLIYIFFSLFNCDGKLCVGGTYPWSSCRDAWAEGNCLDGVDIINRNPTSEEKFYENFVLMQTTKIETNENFPDWFQYIGLIIVPHLLSWLLLFLLIVGGAKIFGKMLYGLISVAVILYLCVFVYVITMYANEKNQRTKFLNYFFTRFPNHVPTIETSWNQFSFEPLIWGFLSTFVHLSIALNLWNGVYPIMGKWIGGGKMKTHLSWVIVPIVFSLFVAIPTLLNVALLASSYSEEYLRCHVSRSWSFPFTIAAHVFTKFATNKALAVAYYVANLCFLLSSESFLLVASIETIIDNLRQGHDTIANHPKKAYRLSCLFLIILLCGLSFSTIIKSGYYWIHLMDFYVDRLMCILMLGQSICLIIIYVFIRRAKFEGKLLKIFFVIFLAFICLISTASLVWFAVDAKNTLPTQDCYYAKLDPNIEPIPSGYVVLGWFISACPILIGLIIGPIIIFVNSRKFGSGKKCLSYFLRGYQKVPKTIIDGDEGEHFMNSSRSRDTRNITSLGRMQVMKDTLQSSSWQQSTLPKSYTDSSTPSNPYVNDIPNVLFDQRQSLRRPLISSESGSQASNQEYAQIKKHNRRSRPILEESDI